MEYSTASLSSEEEIKPYRIHVSSKYLDLTKKKLELTRLPHEILLPANREWENGTPKSEVEPLIDYWLEQYSWRAQEARLNEIPQFRSAFRTTRSNVPLRIHFIHLRSEHANAVPLLLIPGFPLTNLSLRPLFKLLTDNPTAPFHLVVPSIPGLGFSDAFGTEGRLLESTSEIFDLLMRRLGYEFYLASSTGGGDGLGRVDYKLVKMMGERYGESCLGVHLLAPPFRSPNFLKEPLAWAKLNIAKFFRANIWEYEEADWTALKTQEQKAKKERDGRIGYGVGRLGIREPNTFAYALCDSPVGLLSLVCSALRHKSPEHAMNSEEIVDITQLAWLPGPEASMRFFASAVGELSSPPSDPGFLGAKRKAKVVVTIFDKAYMCPAWGAGRYDILGAQRVSGKAGLLVWERPDIVVEGVRLLGREVEKRDARIKVKLLEAVVVGEAEMPMESPDTLVG